MNVETENLETRMTDLKLIDELLIDLKDESGYSIDDLEHRISSVTKEAMRRLRVAWQAGEMPEISLCFANYFSGKDC